MNVNFQAMCGKMVAYGFMYATIDVVMPDYGIKPGLTDNPIRMD